MRKTVLVLATIGLAVLLASGLALAAPKARTTTTNTIQCTVGIACNGSDQSENIYGTSGDDVIFANGGDDKIIPYGGNDFVYAGPGSDEVRHSFGNDYILGGSGADTLRGGFDSDVIWGGPDKDLIDCAYLKPRAKGEDYDTAYANSGEDWTDVVVDCKEVNWGDETNDETIIQSIDPDNPDEPTLSTGTQ